MSRLMSCHTAAKTLRAATAALVLLSAAATPAWGYIDPGTGAMLLQMIAAVFAGALFYFRSFWKRIAAWLTSGKQLHKPSIDSDQSE